MSANRADSAKRTQPPGADATTDKTPLPRSRKSSQSSSHSSPNIVESASTRVMPVSPLKQVNAEHTSHRPKVFALYQKLFTEAPHPPGYWVELFLLPVNTSELHRVLEENPQNFVRDPGLAVVHTLFRAAVANLSDNLPADIIRNALQVLTVVVGVTLDLPVSGGANNARVKKQVSVPPNFSVIQALTGLEHASVIFDDLTSRVLALLYSKNRSLVGQTTLFVLHTGRKLWGAQISSLFSTKNFFAALIAVIADKIDDDVAINALNCIGVLTGVNAYDDEGLSIYKQRLSDYVDEAVMMKILALAQRELVSTDSSETANSVGTSVFAWVSNWFSDNSQIQQMQDTVNQSSLYTEGSNPEHIILPLFLFTVHNSVFASLLAASPALSALIETSAAKKQFTVIKTQSTTLERSHTWLSLLTMRSLVDGEFLVLTDPSSQSIIRLPSTKLVLDASRRVPLAGILDFAVLVLKTGCKTRSEPVELGLLQQAADLIYQVCAQMVATSTILVYNWTQLWKVIVSSLKYLSGKDSPAEKTEANHTVIEKIAARLLVIMVGMSLRRDLLEEEDWHALLFSVLYNSATLQQVGTKFPALAQKGPLSAARAMKAQYELSKDHPDFVVIQKQGILAAGQLLIAEKLRPFSVGLDSVIKWAVKQQIV